MQTFKFEELTEPAKALVRDWYARTTDDHWAEYIVEHAKEEGKKRGFFIDNVMWRGFCSQGDGASWTGLVRLNAFLDYHLKPDNPDFARYTVLRELLDNNWVAPLVTINMRSFHYTHSGGMNAEGPGIYDPYGEVMSKGILEGAKVSQLCESIDAENLCDSLSEWALDEAKNYADDVYTQLEKEYEYEMSDEHIQEIAEINEWRFDEDGFIV